MLKQEINTALIYEAVYNLIKTANVNLPSDVYNKLCNFNCEYKEMMLKNAYLAQLKKRPLCQDTGQVVVFLEIGQNIILDGDYIEDVINFAVKDCYKENFYRKSTVKDAIFDRQNSGDNTPAVIHTKIVTGNEINILLGIKGGGSENVTALKMFNPTASFNEILDYVKECAVNAGENACPPMCIGIGAGGCAETAAMLAKKALFVGKSVDFEIPNVFETKILTAPAHIASLPVCVNLSCHSLRHGACIIKGGKIIYPDKMQEYPDVKLNFAAAEIRSDDFNLLRSLKTGDKIFLSGTIYTARDAAHKKLCDMIKNNEPLPFDLNGKIIFYAGPCPAADGEVIGPVGPTTSKRMDKFASLLYENGVIATIGKGDRNLSGLNKLYFKAAGGVACVLQDCVKKSKLVCFEELGAEAVYELQVEKMPLKAVIL